MRETERSRRLREKRVIQLIDLGLSYPVIAQRIGKSKDTVRLIALAHGRVSRAKKCG